MKKIKTYLLLLFLITILFTACLTPPPINKNIVRGNINIPDLDGFITLKCDFHMHSVFSDGIVWPTTRVNEAFREGLDAIAITEHIEKNYRSNTTLRKYSHNRAYEIANEYAATRDIIVIRGSEITRKMPPGHHNAVFLTDADELDTPIFLDAFKAARAQKAFLFWNHPGWKRQQPKTTLWWTEHTQLLEMDLMHGIEVVSEYYYYPEAHQWCIDHKLTMLGNSDIHVYMPVYKKGKHRAMTLVFARERSSQAIYEALFERRTVVYYKDLLIGEERYLRELFEKSVDINITRTDNTTNITFKNKTDLVFNLRDGDQGSQKKYFQNINFTPYVIERQRTKTITFILNDETENVKFYFLAENLLVAPGEGLRFTVEI